MKYYVQSAFSIPDEEKRAQEIRPFKKIDDSFKKIVITKDIVVPYYDENGIHTMNIYDFLMDEKSLTFYVGFDPTADSLQALI